MASIGDFIDKVKHEVRTIFGKETKDRTYVSQQTFADRSQAEQEFAQAVTKLMNVNAWSAVPGLTSTFKLYSKQGEIKTDSAVQVGDYIHIELPGPAPENWVRVAHVHSAEEEAEFTVNPSVDPRQQGQEEDKEIKHFFTEEASSTFRVELQGNTLLAFEIGRNEGINNQGEEAGDRAVVNTLIAEGGWAGFQAFQWNKLTDYWVHLE